jgi:V/A-type H+/Na+-transporting ATPase subunit K
MNIKTGERILVPVLAVTISLTLVFLAVPEFPLAHAQTAAQKAAAAGAAAGAQAQSSKLIGAGLAFGLAGAGAGIGLGFVGAAGLAAISDNPKMQSRVFIFVGMVESIAIYGIVMMFIILGQ